ncbi:MAG: HYR domain-containing protein [Bacteroidia bacterium]
MIDCYPWVLYPNTIGTCERQVFYNQPMVSDNCPGVTFQLLSGLGSGGIFPVGMSFETYLARDSSGNNSLCITVIQVLDDETPTITCPGDTTLIAPNGQCGIAVNYPAPVATDNCPGVLRPSKLVCRAAQCSPQV